ncbi:MAG: MFS transporter [Chloroflexi bacterium]|nr:MFS transporter [Chloroflexota bacterium]MBT7080067.1 MFS transporter [Chloroflexota bacterium]MBT7289770.1 MFS transporter [Chloroflexota bacterium]
MIEQSDESLDRKKKNPPKMFAGWWTVISAGVTGFWGAGYYHYGFGALLKPISSDLGISHARTVIPTSIGRLRGGIEGPLTGWISDRYGPRLITAIGVFMFGLSLMLMQYVNSTWSLVLIWGIMLGTSSNLYTTPINTALANWFVKKRGLAMAIKRTLDGLSGVLVLPLIIWLIDVSDWRTACIIGGVVMWLVPLPLVIFGVKRHRPEYYGFYPDGARSSETVDDTSQMLRKGAKYATEVAEIEFTIRQAMSTPTFWLLLVAGGCNYLAFPLINVFGIDFLEDIGYDRYWAGKMMAMMVAVSLLPRLISGYFSDRVSRNRMRFIMASAYTFQALGFGIYLLYQTTRMLYTWLILNGIGMGISYALFAPLRARYYGRKAFGSIHGIQEALMTPMGFVAPIYVGWVWDNTGSYLPAFKLVTILLFVAAVVMAFTKAPKPPARITDVTQLA